MKRAALLTITLSCLFLAWSGCGSPPQIGADRDSFKAVDALYTAVSLRDAKLVGQCEANLKSLRDSSKIPQGAFSSLQSIIAEANDGSWEPAQERLTNFMEGQSRSSPPEHGRPDQAGASSLDPQSLGHIPTSSPPTPD